MSRFRHRVIPPLLTRRQEELQADVEEFLRQEKHKKLRDYFPEPWNADWSQATRTEQHAVDVDNLDEEQHQAEGLNQDGVGSEQHHDFGPQGLGIEHQKQHEDDFIEEQHGSVNTHQNEIGIKRQHILNPGGEKYEQNGDDLREEQAKAETKSHQEIEIEERHSCEPHRNQASSDRQTQLIFQGEQPPVDATVLKHAVWLAQNPWSFDRIPGLRLTPLERRALSRDLSEGHSTAQDSATRHASHPTWQWPLLPLEYGLKTAIDDIHSAWTHFNNMTRPFKIVLATCCLAAITQGWDESSINGANQTWPSDLSNGDLKPNLLDPNTKARDVWIFSAVNAVTYMTAGLSGVFLSDFLNEAFWGRKGALFISSLFSIATPIGAAWSTNWKNFLATRVLLGVGMGGRASVVPILMAETAPRRIRGSILLLWQTFVAFGIALGNASNLIAFEAWRWQIGMAFLPALLMLVLVPFCVESPRYLLKKGRFTEAYEAFRALNATQLQAWRDFIETHVQLQSEIEYLERKTSKDIEGHGDPTVAQSSANATALERGRRIIDDAVHSRYQERVCAGDFRHRFNQLFTIRRIGRSTLAATIVMLAQQLTGVNILAFFSSTIFSDAFRTNNDLSESTANKKALWLSFGFSLANFLFVWFAFKRIDREGRRYLLAWSFPNMAWTIIAVGICFLMDADNPARMPLIAIFVLLFTLAYSPGEGPIAFLYTSECFPLSHREVGMGWGVFVNLFGAGILAHTVPFPAWALTHTGLLALFGGLNLVALGFVIFYVPETSFALENINDVMDISTKNHIKYQKEVLIWRATDFVWKLEQWLGIFSSLIRRCPEDLSQGVHLEGPHPKPRPQRPPPFIVWADPHEFEDAASISFVESERSRSVHETPNGGGSQPREIYRVAAGEQDDN